MPKQTFYNLPDEKRELITRLAVEEFAENDYDTASISKIVAQAGIAKGSFYQYFEDKEDLYQYLLEEGGRIKAQVLAENPPPDPAMDIFAYLRWLFQTGLHYEIAYPKLAKIGQRAANGGGPSAAWLQQMEAQSMGFLRDLVAQSVANGHLKPTLDIDMAAYLFYAVSRDLTDYLLKRLNISPEETDILAAMAAREAEAEALFDDLMTMLERGMKA